MKITQEALLYDENAQVKVVDVKRKKILKKHSLSKKLRK